MRVFGKRFFYSPKTTNENHVSLFHVDGDKHVRMGSFMEAHGKIGWTVDHLRTSLQFDNAGMDAGGKATVDADNSEPDSLSSNRMIRFFYSQTHTGEETLQQFIGRLGYSGHEAITGRTTKQVTGRRVPGSCGWQVTTRQVLCKESANPASDIYTGNFFHEPFY